MHFSKIWTPIFAAALLVVPILAAPFAEDTGAGLLAERYVTVHSLFVRAPAPPTDPRCTGKTLLFKPTGKRSLARSLAKRVVTEVAVGGTASGVAADTLWTQALDTCIGLVAYSPNGGGKVLTHAGPAQVQNNYAAFKNAANALGANIQVWASIPPPNQMGNTYAPALQAAIDYIKTQMNKDFSRSPDKFQTRQKPSGSSVQVAEISVEPSGYTFMSECPANN